VRSERKEIIFWTVWTTESFYS